MTNTQLSNVTGTAVRRITQGQRISISLRYQLLLGGGLAILLAILTLLQAVHAYNTTYQLFHNIVTINSTTVDASENALQHLASTSQAAADYALLTSDTPLYEQAQNNIFRDFSLLRDELFTLRDTVQTEDERAVLTIVETFTDSRFWRHVSNLLALRSDDNAARLQYLDADNHVRNWINPALQRLENLNYEQMILAGQRAEAEIGGQVFVLVVPAFLLAALLTLMSFRLRKTIRRYLTPGIDIAVVMGWLLLISITADLMNAPRQLKVMIQDAYRSVSAASRVLVDANLANRAESSILLDPDNSAVWTQRFEDAMVHVELQLCGQRGCTTNSFVLGSPTTPNASVVNTALQSSTNADLAENTIPLMANITFAGEVERIERARLALLEYRVVNQQLQTLIAANKMDEAIALNTSLDAGTSQDTFNRFSQAIVDERELNRAIFDKVWASESARLESGQQVYGIVGYVLMIIAIAAGTYHRFREL